MWVQALSMAGTLLVLTAYFAIVRLGRDPNSFGISWLNVVGSLMLGIAAVCLANVGYIFLNVVWIIVAIMGYRNRRQDA